MHVGAGTYGAENIHIRQWGQGTDLYIGKYCSIANGVTVLLGGNHTHNRVTTYPFNMLNGFGKGTDPDGYSKGNVVIGNDVWVGEGVSIMSGVNIGHGSILAARSHIIKDVAPYSMVGGNPARLIRMRFSESQIKRLLQVAWWEWPLEKIEAFADLLLRPQIDDFLEEAEKAQHT